MIDPYSSAMNHGPDGMSVWFGGEKAKWDKSDGPRCHRQSRGSLMSSSPQKRVGVSPLADGRQKGRQRRAVTRGRAAKT